MGSLTRLHFLNKSFIKTYFIVDWIELCYVWLKKSSFRDSSLDNTFYQLNKKVDYKGHINAQYKTLILIESSTNFQNQVNLEAYVAPYF